MRRGERSIQTQGRASLRWEKEQMTETQFVMCRGERGACGGQSLPSCHITRWEGWVGMCEGEAPFYCDVTRCALAVDGPARTWPQVRCRDRQPTNLMRASGVLRPTHRNPSRPWRPPRGTGWLVQGSTSRPCVWAEQTSSGAMQALLTSLATRPGGRGVWLMSQKRVHTMSEAAPPASWNGGSMEPC